MVLLGQTAGIDVVHVLYKGGAMATQTVFSTPEVKEQVLKLSIEPMPLPSPAVFGERVRSDIAKWGKIIRGANFNPE